MPSKLRFACAGDYPAMAAVYRPYVEDTTISFEYAAPSSEQFAARMRALDGRFPVIVCCDGDEIIGYAYASPAFERQAYCWCADISVYVKQGKLRQGCGRRLVTAVCDILKNLGYRRAYAVITAENVSSRAFHIALGFSAVAEFPEQGYKFGRWLGVAWYEKELCGGEVCAQFPRAFNVDEFDLSEY